MKKRWSKSEKDYLTKTYSTRIPLKEISRKLNRSIKSIQNKAERLGVSHPRKPFDIEKKKERQRKANDNYYKKHRKKVYQRKKQKLKEKKKELIESLGGKCIICGYNKCISALEFHHNQGDKEGCITTIIKNFSKQKALKEIKKCILLCANCHREAHYKGS